MPRSSSRPAGAWRRFRGSVGSAFTPRVAAGAEVAAGRAPRHGARDAGARRTACSSRPTSAAASSGSPTAGAYGIDEVIARGRRPGRSRSPHRWPVRRPRPFRRAARRRRRAARHRPARARPLLPARARQHRLRPRRLRHRQDRAAAGDREVVRRRRDRLRRLRRARQRDGRRARASSARSTDPRTGEPLLDAHGAGRQHVEHAGARPRGEHPHRRHGGRVLPRHGLPRRADRRLDLALGGGAARGRLPHRPAARGGGLSGRRWPPSWRPSTSGRRA